MKIAVCVKHVPEGNAKIDPGTKRLDRSGEGALNHFDANAVEEALRLKGDSDTEVVVVSLGPAKAADSLRKALAMGADRAVLVSDDAAAGSDLVATSKILAAARARWRTPAATARSRSSSFSWRSVSYDRRLDGANPRDAPAALPPSSAS